MSLWCLSGVNRQCTGYSRLMPANILLWAGLVLNPNNHFGVKFIFTSEGYVLLYCLRKEVDFTP